VGVVSFHHVSDAKAALREVRRVLRSSGRVVLHELYPAQHSSATPLPLAKWFHRSKPTLFTPDELRDQMASTGLRDVSSRDGVRGYFVWGAK
jgi:hypothetical protein